MAELTLRQLVAQASALAGWNTCQLGHEWRSQGGRPCPLVPVGHGGNCSQTVYRCAHCGEYDYGDPGGPAHRECVTQGPCSNECRDAVEEYRYEQSSVNKAAQ